jgi:hypothetical protein
MCTEHDGCTSYAPKTLILYEETPGGTLVRSGRTVLRGPEPRSARLPRRGSAALMAAAVAASVCSQAAGAGPGRSSLDGRTPVIGTFPGTQQETYRGPSVPVGLRVTDLLSRMTLAGKVCQMIQTGRENATNVPDLVAALAVMSGAGSGPYENTPAAWDDMVEDFQRKALRTRPCGPGWGFPFCMPRTPRTATPIFL